MKNIGLSLLISTLLVGAEQTRQDSTSAAFSSSLPQELQFSDGIGLAAEEEALASTLAGGDPASRVAAARELWHGHSRRHARAVLKFVLGEPPKEETFAALKQDVQNGLQPQAILHELRDGDYWWGAWLAFVRPHKDLVPELMAGLKGKPASLPETILALGKSGDPRALKPLLSLLKCDDYRTTGDAAQALGYLGAPEAEPKLVEALSRDWPWLQVKACGALAEIGTRRAIPALERLAKDDRYTGVLNVRGMAKHAIESIGKREKR